MNERTAISNRNWQQKFLAALRDLPNVAYACRKGRVSRVTAYLHKNEDSKFALQWEDAVAEGVDTIEEVVMEHAKKGIARPVWMKDEQGIPKKIDTIREYPIGHYAMLLKAHKPKLYREPKSELNLSTVTTAPDGTVTEFAVHVSKEELP